MSRFSVANRAEIRRPANVRILEREQVVKCLMTDYGIRHYGIALLNSKIRSLSALNRQLSKGCNVECKQTFYPVTDYDRLKT